MIRTKACVLYRNFTHGEVLERMGWLLDECCPGVEGQSAEQELLEKGREEFHLAVHGLLELAGNYGFAGNLWHTYLAFLLVNNENTFSKACEIVGAVEGSVNPLALHDLRIFR